MPRLLNHHRVANRHLLPLCQSVTDISDASVGPYQVTAVQDALQVILYKHQR
jgi:hypothetical protein